MLTEALIFICSSPFISAPQQEAAAPALGVGEPEPEEATEGGIQSVTPTELDETPEVIPVETQEPFEYLLPDNQLGMECTPGHDSGDDKDLLHRSDCLNQIQLIESDDGGSPVPPVTAGPNGNFKHKTSKKKQSQFIGIHVRYSFQFQHVSTDFCCRSELKYRF